jgi:hypothetical protein
MVDTRNSLGLFVRSANPAVARGSKQAFQAGRVVKVNLDPNFPDLVGSVHYKILGKVTDNLPAEQYPIAFPLQSHIRHLPLVNEIVLLVSAASKNLDSLAISKTVYYLDVVNIWNSPHFTGFPEDTSSDPKLGEYFEEKVDINPMLPYEGDVILEGRNGQSLRLSQTVPNLTPWGGTVKGDPITILSNGQVATTNGFEFITENINEDFSSIYLTSTQTIPLVESSINRKSYSQKPTETKAYKGNQVLLSSGRIYLNASTDHILLSSPLSIGLSGDTINIDSTNTTIIEANKIELGKNAQEPVLLGNRTTALLEDILNQLLSLSIDLQAAISLPTGGPIVQLQKAGVDMASKVSTLKGQLAGLKSKKTFTK